MKNDETLAHAYRAQEQAGLAEAVLDRQLGSGASSLAATFARAKDEIERVSRLQSEAIEHINEAKIAADAALAGSTNADSVAVGYLDRAGTDAVDNLGKLKFMYEELDKMARDIIPQFTEDNQRVKAKVRGAHSHIYGFINNL